MDNAAPDDAGTSIDTPRMRQAHKPVEFPYDQTFQSIAAAVWITAGDQISISVEKFQEEWNKRATPPHVVGGCPIGGDL